MRELSLFFTKFAGCIFLWPAEGGVTWTESRTAETEITFGINMKNSVRIILVLFAAALLCSGCDFLRSIAGRPTSEDIAKKRALIEAVEAQRAQHRADSLKAVAAARKREKDSLAALQSLAQLSVKVIPSSSLGGVKTPENVAKGYSVIVGSFKSLPNAERMAEKARSYGFPPVVLHLGSGMCAVSICPCGTISEIALAFEKIKDEKFCPKDAWILFND